MPALPAEVASLLAGPNIAHLATLLPDGSPHSVAVWAGLKGENAYFFTQDHSRKARNLRADPRLALSLVAHDNPYVTGWLRGSVVAVIEGEPALELIDALALKYTGKPFPMRSGTVFVVDAIKAGSLTLPFKPA